MDRAWIQRAWNKRPRSARTRVPNVTRAVCRMSATDGPRLMRLIVLLFSTLVGSIVAFSSSRVIDFDHYPIGSLPSEWESAMTKSGGPPRWEIVTDQNAPGTPNVLAQLSTDRTAGRFPLAVLRGVTIRDGEVSVRFKPVAGEVDEAAGLVWRYTDRNNYYIVRANALENNVVLYKVANGERTSLAPRGLPSRSYGIKHAVPKMAWSELKVSFSDTLATVYFNNERLFDVADGTFRNAGRIGLWTKADSVTWFDNFTFSGR
jgi:hypothetical protein